MIGNRQGHRYLDLPHFVEGAGTIRMLRPSRQILRFLNFIVLVLVISTLAGGIASAQRRSRVKFRSKALKGKVVAVGPSAIQVQEQREGGLWTIAPVDASQVEFIGLAKKGWVDKGMIVRVNGTFDKKGIAAEPVDLVQVFTPREEFDIGAEFQGEGKPDRNQPQEYLVAGVVKRIADGKVAVSTGKKLFTFEIADDAKVEVDLFNVLDWVQVGDKVDSKLKYVNQGEGLIETATIKSQTTLVAVEKAPKRKRRSRRSRKAELKAAAENAEVAEVAETADGDEPASKPSSDTKPTKDGSGKKDESTEGA